VDSEALLAELARYEAEIADIESRFIRITDKLFYVQREDDALVRQRVEQLIEILNDSFGVNNYSRQISADFDRAFLFIASAVFCGRYEQRDSALSKERDFSNRCNFTRNQIYRADGTVASV